MKIRIRCVARAFPALLALSSFAFAGEQAIAVRDRFVVGAKFLDQQFGPIQMRQDELRIGLDGQLELSERFLDLAFIPQNLAAAVVGLGAFGMGLQRFIEPGERLIGAPAVLGLHRLIEAIPVTVLVFHRPSPEGGRRGEPASKAAAA